MKWPASQGAILFRDGTLGLIALACPLRLAAVAAFGFATVVNGMAISGLTPTNFSTSLGLRILPLRINSLNSAKIALIANPPTAVAAIILSRVFVTKAGGDG